MKTCKNFCDRYVEKIKKTQALNIEKTKKKLEAIQKQPKKNLKKIKQYKFIIKEYKKIYNYEHETWNRICKTQFCNPGCKKTIYDPNVFARPLINNFSPHTNADYLRKEGAISGCLSKPFFF